MNKQTQDGSEGGSAVLAVGSVNMDMVVTCQRFPRPGETIFAHSFGTFPGGKGANQAVACARLGGRVTFLGKMGEDAFAEELTENLRSNGVTVERLSSSSPTGVALITVDDAGENQIIVASGSNMELSIEDVDRHEALFAEAGVVLLQLEIPLEAVIRSVALARRHGATVILNPAPACHLSASLLAQVDILTPNRIEAAQLAGLPTDGVPDATASAQTLLDRGVGAVVVTLGAEGVLIVTEEGERCIPAHSVHAIDTTGAGDAFNGALACALAEGRALDEAVQFANAAAAVAVTRLGAQVALPDRPELELFVGETVGS
jgi:ribokinase